MNYTNENKLPQPIISAIRNYDRAYEMSDNVDPYNISVTSLIDSPHIRMLKFANKDNMHEDVSENLWKLIGNAIHQILEKSDNSGIKELRLYKTITRLNRTFTLSGQIDYYDPKAKELSDYKITSKYAVKDGTIKREYVEQLNINKYLMETHGFEVNKLNIYAILRDWNKLDKLKHDMPNSNFMTIPIPMMTDVAVIKLINDKLAAHLEAIENPELSKCSDEDRWATKRQFAVMKKDSNRATKLCDTYEEAQIYILKLKAASDYIIDERKPEYRRCEDYCPVKNFCKQYRKYII